MKALTFNNINALPFATEEALNRLCINLCGYGDRFKKVMVTSSIPNEGKSFISFHLARLLASVGKRVVYVDGDIRMSESRARYQISFADESHPSIEEYLAGQASMADIVYSTNIKNLYFVPTRCAVHNPVILLQSPRFENLLNMLAEQYDYVILDTAPVLTVPDGIKLAPLCDGVILVVRCGVTSRYMVADSVAQLNRASGEIIGTVLNRVARRSSEYYYHYSYYEKESGRRHHKKTKKRLPSHTLAERK